MSARLAGRKFQMTINYVSVERTYGTDSRRCGRCSSENTNDEYVLLAVMVPE